eukprot:TRINITY_DN70478_c0_g1_i1.p1 TRINITY_DN70478_c0_g1~~TRINITY_DN70478_c0_g1_i1.p1  ORF type:complete len:902 (+),score=192.06 TRINITY_DN70478_c0_g1_i1:80-2785(+)
MWAKLKAGSPAKSAGGLAAAGGPIIAVPAADSPQRADQSKQTPKQEEGRCQAVEYNAWGSSESCPLPKQWGKEFDPRQAVKQALRDARKQDNIRFRTLCLSPLCFQLLQDMYWYVFLDEFALEDSDRYLELLREASRPATPKSGALPEKAKNPQQAKDQLIMQKRRRRYEDLSPRAAAALREPTHLSTVSIRSHNARALVAGLPRSPAGGGSQTARDLGPTPAAEVIQRPTTPKTFPAGGVSMRGMAGVLRHFRRRQRQGSEGSSTPTTATTHLNLTYSSATDGRESEAGDNYSIASSPCHSRRHLRHDPSRSNLVSVHGSEGESSGDSSSVWSLGREGTPPSSRRAMREEWSRQARERVEAEMDHIFTRMSQNYVVLFRQVPARQKDILFKDLPEVLSRALRWIFDRTLPYYKSLMAEEFRQNLARRVTYWITGVEQRTVRQWDQPSRVRGKHSKHRPAPPKHPPRQPRLSTAQLPRSLPEMSAVQGKGQARSAPHPPAARPAARGRPATVPVRQGTGGPRRSQIGTEKNSDTFLRSAPDVGTANVVTPPSLPPRHCTTFAASAPDHGSQQQMSPRGPGTRRARPPEKAPQRSPAVAPAPPLSFGRLPTVTALPAPDTDTGESLTAFGQLKAFTRVTAAFQGEGSNLELREQLDELRRDFTMISSGELKRERAIAEEPKSPAARPGGELDLPGELLRPTGSTGVPSVARPPPPPIPLPTATAPPATTTGAREAPAPAAPQGRGRRHKLNLRGESRGKHQNAKLLRFTDEPGLYRVRHDDIDVFPSIGCSVPVATLPRGFIDIVELRRDGKRLVWGRVRRPLPGWFVVADWENSVRYAEPARDTNLHWYEAGRRTTQFSTQQWRQYHFNLTAVSPLLHRFMRDAGALRSPFTGFDMAWEST